MKNIGHAFVRLGQYQDAMQSYDTVMEGAPDVVTGYNLVVCFHALGDKEKMKKSFTRLLSTTPPDAADENDADFSADDSGDDGCAFLGDEGTRRSPGPLAEVRSWQRWRDVEDGARGRDCAGCAARCGGER